MTAPLADPLGAMARCRQRLDEMFPHNPRPRDQAALVTQVLQECGIRSALYACQINDGRHDLQVVDQAGRPRPAWATVLASILGDEQLPDGNSAPPGLGLSGSHRLLVEPLPGAGHSVGFLMLAIAEGTDVGAARLVLAGCASHVAMHLAWHAAEHRAKHAQEDLAALERLAELAELGSPLAHEFNNFLNSLVLQLAVLEQMVPASVKPEMTKVRQHANRTAGMVKQLQNYRRQVPTAAHVVDLNHLASEATRIVTERHGAGSKLDLALALGPLNVEADAAELKRMCIFLLGNSVRAAAGGPVTARTVIDGNKCRLVVEDSGPSVAAEALHDVFELGPPARAGTESLELAACRSLARRMRGQVSAENRPEGGLRMILELPASAG